MPNPRLDSILKDWKLWPNLCQSEPDHSEVRPLHEGLTNENWLLKPSKSSQAYVIRCNAVNQSNFYINRQHEHSIHQAIAKTGLCPAIIYEDTVKQYWIRPYITGETLATSQINNQLLEQCTSTLRAIHALPLDQNWPEINLNERFELYWDQLFKNNEPQLIKLKQLKASVHDVFEVSQTYSPALCHMDCNTNNWIINPEKLYLIDWEYAHIGNPAWDLAVFCDSAKLNNEQVNIVLKNYQSITKEQFNQAMTEIHYLESLWFAIKLNQTYDELYNMLKDIFKI